MAGPINGCSDSEAKDWRKVISERLPNVNCIDPMKRDYRGREMLNHREIVELDKLEVAGSDCLIVLYSKPSIGTSMEVLFAWERGIPVLVINTQASPLSPWLLYHSTAIVQDIDRAIEKISFWFGDKL
jgi:hypothetical protein